VDESGAIAPRQSSQRLRTIEIRRMAKVDTSLIRTNYSHQDDGFDGSNEHMYLLLTYALTSAGTLTETATYIALDEHDQNVGEQLESYMHMF